MQTLTIDFETFYSDTYSLKNITTQEYILHPEFEIIGVAVQINNGEPVWFTGTLMEVKKWLEQFDFEHSLVIAHNAMFDGGILELVLDIHPKIYFCTMMGSRPLVAPFIGSSSLHNVSRFCNVGEKLDTVYKAVGRRRLDIINDPPFHISYATYCKQDVRLCYLLFKQFVMVLPREELKMIDLHIKKFTRPQLVLNKDTIEEALAFQYMTKDLLLVEAGLDSRETLMSNAKFAAALQDLGVDPPMKVSPSTGKPTYAFAKSDVAMRKLEYHPDPRVQTLVAARLGHKSTIEITRLERFYALAKIGKPLSVPLLYYGAHTGRSSGYDKLNLQNLTRKSKLRAALEAPTGYSIIAADLSQIEARIVAALAGQHDLVKQFASGSDVYSWFASDIYGKTITKETHPKERFVGKTAVLQLGYGAGPEKFHLSINAQGADITEQEAARTVSAYRHKFFHIKKLWFKMEKMIIAMSNDIPMTLGPVSTGKEALRLPNGMDIFYPDLQKGSDGWVYRYQHSSFRKLYGAKLTENIVQALARIVLRDTELILAQHGFPAVLNVHDELLFVVKDEHVDTVITAIKAIMRRKVDWLPELPVDCEVAYGKTYAECK